MGMFEILFWPFTAAFVGLAILISIIVLAFWIWMIVDCAQRKFKNDVEKILWLVIIVLGQWIGALVYLIVVKLYNSKGLMKK